MIISILNNTILTITQSLVKSTKLINSNNINFNDIQESNWDRVLQDNNTLSLLSLLNDFVKECIKEHPLSHIYPSIYTRLYYSSCVS